MKVSQALTLLPVLAGVSRAVPVGMAKRQQNLDLDILQFALTLEHLENVFYKEALQKFDQAAFQQAGFDQHFFQNMLFIVQDEEKHVQLLSGALSAAGAKPVQACKYNFGITDINSFVTLSTILEGVGTSAYLGGAPLLQNKDILTTAGAILVTEALHTSQQRAPIGLVPAANDLGTPLDANSVFTLASGFIVECPADNAPLPFKANAKLAVNTSSCPAAGAAPPAPPAGSPPAGHSGPPSPPQAQQAGGKPSPPSAAPPAGAAHGAGHSKREVKIQTGLVGLQKNPAAPVNPAQQAPPAGPGAPPPPPQGQADNGGKVTAAQPCPFLSQGQEAKFNAEQDIPAGSFMTFVSGLSVVSTQGQISGKSASASVPAGIMGQSYVFITNKEITDNKLPAEAIVAGPAILEVQPPAPTIDFNIQ